MKVQRVDEDELTDLPVKAGDNEDSNWLGRTLQARKVSP